MNTVSANALHRILQRRPRRSGRRLRGPGTEDFPVARKRKAPARLTEALTPTGNTQSTRSALWGRPTLLTRLLYASRSAAFRVLKAFLTARAGRSSNKPYWGAERSRSVTKFKPALLLVLLPERSNFPFLARWATAPAACRRTGGPCTRFLW